MSSLSILINNGIVSYGSTELLHDPVAVLNDNIFFSYKNQCSYQRGTSHHVKHNLILIYFVLLPTLPAMEIHIHTDVARNRFCYQCTGKC